MFENATAADWTRARDIIYRTALRDTGDAARADDLAQQAMMTIITRRWKAPPESPTHAAFILRKQARRMGWHTLDPSAANALRRKSGPAPVIDRGTMPPPDAMAMAAERHGIPVDRVHAAHGIGPGALAEPGHTPSVYGSGPATPTPVAGARFARLATDPNLDATLAARSGPVWREGADLTHYRDQLAEYYAGR
jgi:hypothetical protein